MAGKLTITLGDDDLYAVESDGFDWGQFAKDLQGIFDRDTPNFIASLGGGLESRGKAMRTLIERLNGVRRPEPKKAGLGRMFGAKSGR